MMEISQHLTIIWHGMSLLTVQQLDARSAERNGTIRMDGRKIVMRITAISNAVVKSTR